MASPRGWSPVLGSALPWRWWSGAGPPSCCCCCNRAGTCTWWELGGCPCLASCCLHRERGARSGWLRARNAPSPTLPAREPTQSLGRTDRRKGWAGGEVHRGRRDRPGGRVVPTATRVELALLCPCGSPGWVTPWGCTARGCQGAQWDTHTAQPSVGSRTQPGLGELRGLQLLQEAAATGSAHLIPPLARPTRSQPQTLCAAEPGPPPLRLLRPGSTVAPDSAMLARPPAEQSLL